MAKKISKTVKAKPRAVSSPDSVAKLKQTIAAQAREIREAQEQRAATGEILRMIARTPTDLQGVMDATAENAASYVRRGGCRHMARRRRCFTSRRSLWTHANRHVPGEGFVFDRDTPNGRAVIDRQTIHIHDLVAAQAEFPRAKNLGVAMGVRTALVAPLLREGNVIGTIHIRRREIRPFVRQSNQTTRNLR